MPPSPGEPAKITRDLPCIGCGYNLRGLAAAGPCPECGTPAKKSFAGIRLGATDPAWLKKIVVGQRLLAQGLTVAGISLLLFFMLAIGLGLLSLLLPSAPAIVVVRAVAVTCVMLAMLGSLAALTVGVFIVTVLEPRESLREVPTSARVLARWGMSATLLLACCGSVLPQVIGQVPVVTTAMTLAIAGALTVATTALLAHLERLAPRIPDQDLVQRTRKFRRLWQWVLPGGVLAGTFAPHIMALSPTGSMSIHDVVLAPLMIGLMMLPLVLIWHAVLFVLLLNRHRRALQRCWEQAKAPSGAPPRPPRSADRSRGLIHPDSTPPP